MDDPPKAHRCVQAGKMPALPGKALGGGVPGIAGVPPGPGRRPEMDNPPEARNGQPAEGPQVFKRAGPPRSQGGTLSG